VATTKKAAEEKVIPGPPQSKLRRFWLYRHEDPSGISGTGFIAEGVEWTDGRVDVRFLSSHKTENRYPNMKEMANLHGHDGRTQIVWIDELPREEDGK